MERTMRGFMVASLVADGMAPVDRVGCGMTTVEDIEQSHSVTLSSVRNLWISFMVAAYADHLRGNR